MSCLCCKKLAKMGFDLTIRIDMELDEKTGLPFVYYVNEGFLDKKPYNPIEFQIPQEYRKYIEQRGHHFHEYIKRFSPDCMKASVRDFLDVYPDWSTIKESIYDFEWSEKDHEEFKDALKWMVDKSPYICVFDIYWSY
jgi:hypothetical protein